MGAYTAHVDTFARDNLPPASQWPQFVFDLPELQYPERLNAASLLDDAAAQYRDKDAVVWEAGRWSYGELLAKSNQIARVLRDELGLKPGNRVLLHASNSAMTIACWWAVLKAGGVVVTTMPMLRAREISVIVDKARISHVLAEASLWQAIEGAREATDCIRSALFFGPGGELEGRMASQASDFENVPTASDDPALIAFTSGTTGKPKGCIHFHRDILSMANTFARYILKPTSDDVFCGTPPFAFTFGLGGSVVFPAAFGASTALSTAPGYDALCDAIARHKVTTLFTAPTAYRAIVKAADLGRLSSLKQCISAGEPLAKATSEAWFEATGLRLIDGIGSTEMIHIFISAAGEDIRPGSTGKPIPGFQACVIDDDGQVLELGSIGRLAIRGPTGCRYLADDRQANYVVNGWNVTGDVYRVDEDGYFWFVARADDMIISSGYNIAAPEVEQALLLHPKVAETAVVGVPEAERGHICKAFVVLHQHDEASDGLKAELQDFVKSTIAPYKYPRAVEFVRDLPKTETGKLQRFRLKTP